MEQISKIQIKFTPVYIQTIDTMLWEHQIQETLIAERILKN